MSRKFERRWTGDGWQEFALALVQLRHGATNVQRVPDAVRGDGGLEFFTTDGCLIQCYAPEEVADTAKASSAMKRKATRDLPKLVKYKDIISDMLQGTKARRWILLCPFLDDKAVVAHVRGKGAEVTEEDLEFLDDDFEALVQSQEDFAIEIETLKSRAIGPQLNVSQLTDEDVAAHLSSNPSDRLETKLRHAFPGRVPDFIKDKKQEYVRSYLHAQNTLDALRTHHPTLWEQAFDAISAEERRLVMIGASGDAPLDKLEQSLRRIEEGLKRDLPSLRHATRTDLSVGTLSDWLIRCPLDFH